MESPSLCGMSRSVRQRMLQLRLLFSFAPLLLFRHDTINENDNDPPMKIRRGLLEFIGLICGGKAASFDGLFGFFFFSGYWHGRKRSACHSWNFW